MVSIYKATETHDYIDLAGITFESEQHTREELPSSRSWMQIRMNEKCITKGPIDGAAKGAPYMAECDGRDEQLWKISRHGKVQSKANMHEYLARNMQRVNGTVILRDELKVITPSTLLWTLESSGAIRNSLEGEAVCLSAGDGDDALVMQAACTAETAKGGQKWIIEKPPVNVHSGKWVKLSQGELCVTMKQGKGASSSAPVMERCVGSSAQLWSVGSNQTGIHHILNKDGAHFLVSAAAQSKPTVETRRTDTVRREQVRWSFRPDGAIVTATGKGRVLCLTNGQMLEKFRLKLRACQPNQDPAQVFKIQSEATRDGWTLFMRQQYAQGQELLGNKHDGFFGVPNWYDRDIGVTKDGKAGGG
jgi:hypothetical protein